MHSHTRLEGEREEWGGGGVGRGEREIRIFTNL